MSALAKDLNIGVLLDFYGSLLPEKQRQVIDYYYNEDLSLSEIADLIGMTRQGVRDAIKRGEATLVDTEEKLRFEERFRRMSQQMERLKETARAMEQINQTLQSEALAGQIDALRQTADTIDRIGPEVL
jgi:predicted DNA-binding protein YlxM (UPF0122 family)